MEVLTKDRLVSAYGMACGQSQRCSMPGELPGVIYQYPAQSFYVIKWMNTSGRVIEETRQRLINARKLIKQHGGSFIDPENVSLWLELERNAMKVGE